MFFDSKDTLTILKAAGWARSQAEVYRLNLNLSKQKKVIGATRNLSKRKETAIKENKDKVRTSL